jgi:hypothetical protein
MQKSVFCFGVATVALMASKARGRIAIRDAKYVALNAARKEAAALIT